MSLQPDLATTQLVGSETIVLRVTAEELTQLAFSANALQFSAVTLDAAPVAVSSDKDAIVFTLPRPLRQGAKVTLRFAMQGKPARGVTAVAGALYTSYFACDWMVCLQDSPGDKAQLALDLLLPVGVQSLGVGRRVAITAGPDGLMWHRWQSTRAYSPYLYAFAAGHFVHRRLPAAAAGELLALDATGTGADLARLFESSAGMAAFFADKAGLPLPDGRYTQLLVPGREAQESASFSLIGVDELQREQDDPASAWVAAHEMAHQWWGNQVTCASWRDFWLNEGITTFMVAAWQQHHLGEAAYVQALDVARRRLAEARDAGFDQPLTWSGPYRSLRLRRAVQYSKGALFMAELRQTLGETAFWRGLRAYTRLHAGGRVTSRDFQLAMQKASGRDLSPLFAAWVYAEPPP